MVLRMTSSFRMQAVMMTFGFFALCGQSLGEGTNDWITTSCRERRHVEHVANGGASARDAARAAVASAVVVERRQADQGGDRLAIEASQFGHFGHERGAGDLGDAGTRGEQLDLGPPVVVGLQAAGRFRLPIARFLFPGVFSTWRMLFWAARAVACCRRLDSIVRRSMSCRRRATSCISSARCAGIFFQQTRLDLLAEAGQDQGVDAVGLGQNSQRFGEVAHLPRIDHGHAVAGFDQRRDQAPFVSARGFDHDASLRWLEATDRSAKRIRRDALATGRRCDCVGRAPGHVQRLFGDINSDPGDHAESCIMEPSLPCKCELESARGRASALAAVRA